MVKPIRLVCAVALLATLAFVAAARQQDQVETTPACGIAQISIHDREGYRLYEAGFMPIFFR